MYGTVGELMAFFIIANVGVLILWLILCLCFGIKRFDFVGVIFLVTLCVSFMLICIYGWAVKKFADYDPKDFKS